MKKQLLSVIISAIILTVTQQACATDLWGVYEQGLRSDPTYQQAWATEMATAASVPENRAALLPQLSYTGTAGLKKVWTEASATDTVKQTQRYVNYALTLDQNIFNFTNWKKLSSAKDSVKSANATYNAAAQDLIKRITEAYFAVLEAQDVLRYTGAEKRALYRQYKRAKEGLSVGINTITDVYNAKAAYDESVADYVTAKNDLAGKREDLRAITNVYYPDLSTLKGNFPLATPKPGNMSRWVATANQQNWELVAVRYDVLSAHDTVWAQKGGHLPTLDLDAQYARDYTRTLDTNTYTTTRGPTAELDLTVPIFSGGSVSAQVDEATANYEVAVSKRDKKYRDVANETRKDYLAVLSDISKVKADQQAVVSNHSSLKAMEEGYQVGTRTMVDVLNAQKSLYEAQKTWATDRYDYISKSIELKEAAGTLGEDDLHSINSWLTSVTVPPMPTKKVTHKTVPAKKTAPLKKLIPAKKIHHVTNKPTASHQYYYLQVGSYTDLQDAQNMVGQVNAVSNAICRIYPAKVGARTVYRVQVGPLSTLQLAHTINMDLQKAGLPEPDILKKPAK